jgi:type VI secretion system secreted protein Hcp
MAVDYFLALDTIKGESIDATYKGQIQVLSWSFGESNTVPPPTTGGGGAGKPNFSDFNLMKLVDAASPLLIRACALGTTLKTATLSGRRTATGSAGKPFAFLLIQFTNVHVTSVQQSGSSEVPSESVSLQYSAIKYTETPTTATGAPGTPITFTYDLATNKGS